MKKFVIRIAVFFLIIVAVDICFGKVCDYMIKNSHHGSTKALYDLCLNDKYDILIMGSSKAHHNYIPQIFVDSLNMSCYNAGQDGNGIILTYGILQLIDESRLPKTIIYDFKQQFDLYHISEDGDYTRYFDLLKLFYGIPAIDEIIKSISPSELVKMKSSLYRYNGNLVNILSGYLRHSPKDINKGYSPREGYLTDDSDETKDYSELAIDSLKFSYFKKLVEFTKDKGIKLIVVLSPEYKAPFSNDFKPMYEECQKNGIIVLDYFNHPEFQNIEYYYDHCHLNTNGAKVFSKTIVEVLKKML